ncbi:MAG: site-2 protease family protein [Baekduia sp.]
MRRPQTMPLAHVFGVRIGAAPSWFVFLGLAIVFLTTNFDEWIPSASQGELFGLAAAAALAFSASVALHELGHALTARRFGIDVIGIDLWVLGGFTHLSREPERAREEFLIAAAGPAVNVVLVALCLLLTAAAAPDGMSLTEALAGTETDSALVVLGSWLALINGGLLLFNLLPGYPLDGGRMAQAVIWKLTGSRGRATRLTGIAGRTFGLLIATGGLVLLWTSDSIAGFSLMLLGWFLAQGARGAVMVGEFHERLTGVTAEDVMDREPPTFADLTTATDALDSYPRAPDTPPAAAVIDGAGVFIGVVPRDHLEHALAQGRPMLTAADLIADHGPGPEQIPGETPLEQLLKSERLQQWGVVPVVDAAGGLRGLVTVDRVRQALRVR